MKVREMRKCRCFVLSVDSLLICFFFALNMHVHCPGERRGWGAPGRGPGWSAFVTHLGYSNNLIKVHCNLELHYFETHKLSNFFS
jgi:hypothetical protein